MFGWEPKINFEVSTWRERRSQRERKDGERETVHSITITYYL